MRDLTKPAARSHPLQRYAAPALDKGLDILELFAAETGGMNASEVARRLGRTVGEIFRMLYRLEQRGYVSQVPPDDRYFLTLKLFEVAQSHNPIHRLASEARPLLQRVAHATGQSCHLTMLSQGQAVVIAQVDAPGNMGFAVRLGARIDLLNTASGHVMLAFQDANARARSLAAWQQQSGKKPPRDLEGHLERILRCGHEELASHQIKGVIDIGFPVFNQHGEPVAVMIVPFLPKLGDNIDAGDVKDALRRASGQLSAAIGFNAQSVRGRA
jgi:DNA-binding IclR family transcriptional regulator